MSNDTLPLSVSACLATPACKEAYQQIDYIPNLAGNALFLALFGIGLCLQIWFGFRFKTWGYLVAMFGGIVLEIIGYGARIGLHNNIFDNNQFIIYIVGLTIGPAFFSAAVYLSLGRIIAIFGSGLCWFKPKTITLAFISCDFLSLVLQAAGGAIASTSDTQSSTQQGINLMIAGLATQVAFTTIFCLVCLQLAWAIRKYPQKLDETYRSFRQTMRFRLYLGAIGTATIAILIRCTFRVAELSEGFDGSLANNEALFMVLDGAMMIICVTALTAAHPGLMLGSLWDVGGFHWRSQKNSPVREKGSPAPSSQVSETRV